MSYTRNTGAGNSDFAAAAGFLTAAEILVSVFALCFALSRAMAFLKTGGWVTAFG